MALSPWKLHLTAYHTYSHTSMIPHLSKTLTVNVVHKGLVEVTSLVQVPVTKAPNPLVLDYVQQLQKTFKVPMYLNVNENQWSASSDSYQLTVTDQVTITKVTDTIERGGWRVASSKLDPGLLMCSKGGLRFSIMCVERA